MAQDICVPVGDGVVNVRVGAIIEKNGRLLMVGNEKHDYVYSVGGRIQIGESAEEAIVREVREETGVKSARLLSEDIFSLESLTVDGHEKRGAYVPSHLHLNLTYLLEADEHDALQLCEAENSGVRWFPLEEALTAPSEPWMIERIYRKLNGKLPPLT